MCHSLSRRSALITAAAVTAIPIGDTFGEAGIASDDSYVLSGQGCGRATGYAEANKIVTVDGRTHVAWLDSPPEGFRVRVKTIDHLTGQWSPTYTIGEGFDNHGGPALTADSQGYLHVIYYPHHDAMRYRKSVRPGDASAWEKEIRFGKRLSYPTLVCDQSDTLYFTARRSFADRKRPWQVEFWKRSPSGSWQFEKVILQSRYSGYSHFQESLAWGPEHRTLHLCCRFHEKSDGSAYGRLQTVAYLVSPDGGETWQQSDGKKVDVPVTAESAEVLASGGVDQERTLRAGGMSVDPSGRVHVVYSVEESGRSTLLIARPNGDGSWERVGLEKSLPNQWSSRNLLAPAGITFTQRGEMIVTAQMQRASEGESTWANPTNEVVLFRSNDGGKTFSFSIVSQIDDHQSHWLPSIERATGHNLVHESPGLIYTAGEPGKKNTDLLSNEVVFRSLTMADQPTVGQLE